jgi:hypothetical protein
MEMVKDAQDDECILGVQPIHIVRDQIAKPAIRPLLATDEVRIGLYRHHASFRPRRQGSAA